MKEIVAHNIFFDMGIIKKELNKIKELSHFISLFLDKEPRTFCTSQISYYTRLAVLYNYIFDKESLFNKDLEKYESMRH